MNSSLPPKTIPAHAATRHSGPLVSVVIPVYNAASYIVPAIESVLNQSEADLELILVDDGSTDHSATLIKQRVPTASYHYQPNQGAGAARNLGIAHAQGRFLAFLDADDLWTPDKLSRQLAAFEADPQLDLVTGRVSQFHSPDLPTDLAAKLHCPEQPLPGYHFGALLARRRAFERVGPISTHLTLGESLDWFDRARAAQLQLRELPEVVLLRRLHAANLSVRMKSARSDYARVLKECLDRRRAAGGQTPPRMNEAG